MKKQLSKKQKIAHKRNWSKGLVMCSVQHFRSLRKEQGLSFAENMKILRCETILKDIIDNWKPTL